MKLMIYSIFDNVAQVYNRPYYMVNSGMATRSFTDEVNRPSDDNPMYKHPNDYDLYLLGEFDDETGTVVTVNPVLIVKGSSVAVKVKSMIGD